MSDGNGRPRPTISKKGGYPGGRPASEVPPPAKVPSGTIKPPSGNDKK